MLFSFSAISISVFFHQSQVYWIFVSICHSEINFLSDKLNIFSLKAFHVLLSWKTQTSYYNVSARLCYIRALPYSKAFRKCSPNDGWILGWWKTSSYLLSLRPLKSLSTGCCGVMKRQHKLKWNSSLCCWIRRCQWRWGGVVLTINHSWIHFMPLSHIISTNPSDQVYNTYFSPKWMENEHYFYLQLHWESVDQKTNYMTSLIDVRVVSERGELERRMNLPWC